MPDGCIDHGIVGCPDCEQWQAPARDREREINDLRAELAAARAVLNDEEQEVMDHICRAMGGILDLGLRADTDNLRVELAAAVHALQAFPVQHMLQRIAPGRWGNWFDPALRAERTGAAADRGADA